MKGRRAFCNELILMSMSMSMSEMNGKWFLMMMTMISYADDVDAKPGGVTFL
jgi:hypothetical protein